MAPKTIFTQFKRLISGVEQERDFFMLLLVEGSTGAERKEFLGGEGQEEFAPKEMEHIQACTRRGGRGGVAMLGVGVR